MPRFSRRARASACKKVLAHGPFAPSAATRPSSRRSVCSRRPSSLASRPKYRPRRSRAGEAPRTVTCLPASAARRRRRRSRSVGAAAEGSSTPARTAPVALRPSLASAKAMAGRATPTASEAAETVATATSGVPHGGMLRAKAGPVSSSGAAKPAMNARQGKGGRMAVWRMSASSSAGSVDVQRRMRARCNAARPAEGSSPGHLSARARRRPPLPPRFAEGQEKPCKRWRTKIGRNGVGRLLVAQQDRATVS